MSQYDTGIGWPSFWQPLAQENVVVDDKRCGMVRTAVSCALCDAHRGRVFDEARSRPGGDTA